MCKTSWVADEGDSTPHHCVKLLIITTVKCEITNEFCKDYLRRKGFLALLGYKY